MPNESSPTPPGKPFDAPPRATTPIKRASPATALDLNGNESTGPNTSDPAGSRSFDALLLDEELRSCTDTPGHSFCWIGLLRPSASEIDAVAAEFGLHGLVVEDTIKAHQRPKLERYGEVEFVVLRPARYVDPVEVVEIGEVHVFLGPDFVITVRHAQEPDLAEVRHRLEADPDLLVNGPYAVLYAVMDKIVDDYGPVLEGLQVDIDEIEVQVFDGDPNASKRSTPSARR